MLDTTEQITRRNNVANLLRAVADQKLVFGNTREAERKARQAYDLARKSPKLDEPWLTLSAYRLAHLSFRSASTRTTLEKIEQLFREASASRLFSPFPEIYRLSVLHRMRSDSRKGHTDAEILEAFDDAVASFRRWQASFSPEGNTWQRAQLQSGVFNMLELASYFLGMPYQLDGLGGDHIDSSLGSLFPADPALHWVLVGHEEELKTVRYSKSLALAELDAMGRRCPDAILFKLSSREENHVRLGADDDGWQRAGVNGLKLLAILLLKKARDRDDLHFMVMRIVRGGDTRPFRQMKHRLIESLAEMTKPHHETFLEEDLSTGIPRINGRIPVYGAIEWKMFRN